MTQYMIATIRWVDCLREEALVKCASQDVIAALEEVEAARRDELHTANERCERSRSRRDRKIQVRGSNCVVRLHSEPVIEYKPIEDHTLEALTAEQDDVQAEVSPTLLTRAPRSSAPSQERDHLEGGRAAHGAAQSELNDLSDKWKEYGRDDGKLNTNLTPASEELRRRSAPLPT
ncbi:uncharacterized protein SCHCODRAFT_02502989 [Schizophyllum commune H4-8]|nr:uncharacterized protein SCHCODRAFT_02502989 [Schizophyllum commune H4-8]KAI5891902.1 hypothetical protein SCHCODRAFT_02502989 [Schizophyllum commune H4-8]